MGFEESLGTKIRDVKRHVSSRHERSKSFSISDKRVKEDNLDVSHESTNRLNLDIGEMKGWNDLKRKPFPNNELQSSLKQEVTQLERRLQDQFAARKALEGALGYSSSLYGASGEMPKPAKELIKEIAVLEVEVVHLEKYLLSLYRKAFDRQNSSKSPSRKNETLKSPPITRKGMFQEGTELDSVSKIEHSPLYHSELLVPHDSLSNPRMGLNAAGVAEKDSGVHRSQSTLDQRSTYTFRISPDEAKDMRSCFSQPLYFQHAQCDTSGAISLAEHLGTSIADHVPQTPTRISEDMIRCISAIYCKLSDPPLMHHGHSSSPISSSSSLSAFSPQEQYDTWSPHFRKDSSFDAHLDNPFNVEGLKEFSGPYSTMAEIPWICRDRQRLDDIDDMLHNYRLLVRQLEKIDFRKMKHEEKLAFWINIHNALVMHALLIYGVPPNNVKRTSLTLKAAYNIGGHTISADTIQSSILGCRMPRPVQWLRILVSAMTKSKARYDQKAYAIQHQEPLLYFALCSGSHSDPAVRIYTPKRIIQELEAAKEEYIRATLGVRDERKILLPKIVESYAKDSSLSPAAVVEMTQQSMSETLGKTLKALQKRSRKSIEWIPHNFEFRYLLSNELVK